MSLTNWEFWRLLLGNSLISGVLIALLGWFISRRIKKLEVDYQKEMSNFSKYTEKKHEAYQLLCEAVAKAVGEISILWSPYQQYPDFSKYTEEDVEEFLKGIGYKKPAIRVALDQMREDKERMIRRLEHIYDLKVKGADTYKTCQEFLERIYVAEIYLSDEVLTLAKQLANIIRSLVINLDYRETEIRRDVWKEAREQLKKIDELKPQLMAQMKKELQGMLN